MDEHLQAPAYSYIFGGIDTLVAKANGLVHTSHLHHVRGHHCHFPTSRANPPNDGIQSQYKRITISSSDKDQAGIQQAYLTATPVDVLLTAWAVLLHKYTGNEIVSFASICTLGEHVSSSTRGKYSSSTEIGIDGKNIAVVRYRVSEHSQLQHVCEASREQQTARAWFQDGSVNTAILFLDHSKAPKGGQRDAEVRESADEYCRTWPWGINNHTDVFLEADSSLHSLTIGYRQPAIKQVYAATISSTFLAILTHLISNPGSFVDQLDIIDHEQKLRIQSWNPPLPFSAKVNACMHDLVSAKCHQIPTSEAVCSWEGSLTYLELDHISSVFARQLQFMGVGPGMYVPFAYEKSIWAVVATLAILKAGGAFVPLNPKDPKARLGQILQNVGARVVVTLERFVGLFMSMVERVVVISGKTAGANCSDDLSDGDQGIKHKFTHSARPSDPIFVLFTSGSTGNPKGIIHTHSAITTHALCHGKAMAYENARVLQFAAYTFDVAIIDIYTTLLFGGCICVPSEEERRGSIVEVIQSMRADYAILTPSFAGVIDPSDVATLKTLAVGGEALPQERIQRWAGKVRLIQIYGPAEVGICVTKDMDTSTRPETLGRPLENSSCWLVDPDDSECLVPIGAVGELIVAGPSLAQGYLNDAERTARSFIAAPSWAQHLEMTGGRFYKTGDLLRYNLNVMDGTLDFVGRKDIQIKLRGQRIEPGEVEYHIGHLPGVAVCMVTRPEHGCFAGELVAMVQLHDGNIPSTRIRDEALCLASTQSLHVDDVHERLRKVLPQHMIPNALLVVNCMPLVPSLKVDRRRVVKWLEDMDTNPLESSLSLCAILDPAEKTAIYLSMRIAEYVAPKDKARCSRLQRHDFFLQEVGINSIQIISLSMFLQKHYATKVPMALLLSSTLTIRGLAYLVDPASLPPSINGHSSLLWQEPIRVDICKEAALLSQQLLEVIQTQPLKAPIRPKPPTRNVLLTGATGYLGTAILYQLLSSPKTHVYASVRCANPSDGLQRLIESAKHHGWWREEYRSRLHIWKGDVTQPNLGLGPQEVQRIRGEGADPSESIHALIHNAARVHYSSSYSALKAVNVTATVSALRLAAQAPYLSAFVYVSGGVSPSFDVSCPPPTSSSSTSASSSSSKLQLQNASGYTLTKQVSEQLVKYSTQPHSTIFPSRTHVRIVKPGYIIGNCSTGIANQSDFLWRLIAGCVEIGAYNADDAGRWVAVADMERVARDVVGGAMEEEKGERDQQGGETFAKAAEEEEVAAESTSTTKSTVAIVRRITDGLPLHELWHLLRTTYNYPLTPLPQEEWLSKLLTRVRDAGEDHLLYPLMHILERDRGCIGEEQKNGNPMTGSAGVKEALSKNVEFLIRVGFLPKGEERL